MTVRELLLKLADMEPEAPIAVGCSGCESIGAADSVEVFEGRMCGDRWLPGNNGAAEHVKRDAVLISG